MRAVEGSTALTPNEAAERMRLQRRKSDLALPCPTPAKEQ